MEENTNGIAMNGLLPLLFYVFTLFIPKHIIPDFAIYQRIALLGILFFYWARKWCMSDEPLRQNTSVGVIELGIISFIAFQVLRLFFIPYPSAIWTFINHWLCFLFLLLSIKNIPFNTKNEKWYWAIHFSCLVYVAQISYAFFKISNSGEDGFNFIEYSTIGLYTTGNTNFLSGALALHIPFLLFFKNSSQLKTALSYLLIFFCLILIFLLNSRGVSFSIILMFLLWGIKRVKNFSLVKYLVLPIFVVCSILFVGSQINDKTAFFKSYNPISSLDQSDNDGRMMLWDKSIRLFKEKPLLGHGMGSWKFEYLKFGLSDLKISKDRFFYTRHAHNFLFELLAEAGILGLFFFLLLVVYPIFISYQQENDLAFLLLFLNGCFVMFYGFYYQSDIGLTPHIFIWIFALSRLKFKSIFELGKIASFIGLMLVGLSLCHLVLAFYSSKQLSRLSKIPKTEAYAFAQKLEEIHHPIFMTHSGRVSIKEQIATAYWKAGEKEESVAWGELAKEDNPYRANTYFNLGLRYKSMGNFEQAKLNLERAYALNNTIARIKIELSKLALKMEDWDSFNKYTIELETETRRNLGWYYSDELIESSNVIANKYIDRQCYLLDEVLRLKVRETKVRYGQ